MIPVYIDFETYWSTTHSLTRMPPTEYVMHSDTEIQAVAIKVANFPTDVFFGEDKIQHALNCMDWSDKIAVPFKRPVSLTYRVCFGDNRRRDLDGWSAACAPWLDAIVDLGIIADDSTRYLRSVTYSVMDGETEAMEIEIREAV